jgi:predicted Zn-dependent protease
VAVRFPQLNFSLNYRRKRTARRIVTAPHCDKRLHAAIQLQQAGRLDEAEVAYRSILSQCPNHADALDLLGAVALQRGRFHEAADLIQRAIALNPVVPGYHCNFAQALKGQRRFDDAIDCARERSSSTPTFSKLTTALDMRY